MRKMTDDEKLKYAIEELNRYIRFIDNFSWLLASVLLTGTVFVFNKIYLLLLDPHTILRLILIILFDITIILVWKWFFSFLNESLLRSQILFERINLYERELSIDILPNFIDNPYNNIKIKILNKLKRITFNKLMKNIRNLVWFLTTISFGIKTFYVILTILEQKKDCFIFDVIKFCIFVM